MWLVAVAVGAVVVAAGSWLTFYQAPGDLGFEGTATDPLTVGLTALLMFVGVFSGGLFRRLAGPERRISFAQELKEVASSSSFLAALCVSPFVFFGVYVVVRDAPGNPASYLLAFQNGFFCEAVFRRMFPKMEPSEHPKDT